MKRVSGIHIFSDLSESEHQEIEKRVNWIAVPKKTILVANSESTDEVYFLTEGSVRATLFSISGREVSYQDLGPGEMFGELSAIDANPRTTSIVALSDCVVGKISAADFKALMEKYPSVMHLVTQRLAGLVRFLIGRIYEFAALDVKDRVRAEIVRLSRDNMTSSNAAIIPKMPTHEAVANKIVTHREAVTKEISFLLKNNYIEKEGKQITVPDIQRLEALLPEMV